MKMSINNLQSIILGREKDGGVKTIEIDCSEWKEQFPQLTKYRIEVTSPNGIIYCPEVTMNEHILTWPITKSDTALTGKGAYQIVATGENDERLTSAHLSLNIYSIMPGTAQETPPEYIESWVQNIVDTAERAELAAKKAEDAAAGIVITPEEIQSAVDNYLIKNPIKVEETDPTVPDWAKEKKKPTYTAEEVDAQPKGDYALKSDIPAVPVKSVNGKTGTIVLNASDVGAQPKGDYALKSDIPEILVKSVNGKTGDVVLTAQNVGALPADAEIVDQTARDGVATLSEEIGELKGGSTAGSQKLYNHPLKRLVYPDEFSGTFKPLDIFYDKNNVYTDFDASAYVTDGTDIYCTPDGNPNVAGNDPAEPTTLEHARKSVRGKRLRLSAGVHYITDRIGAADDNFSVIGEDGAFVVVGSKKIYTHADGVWTTECSSVRYVFDVDTGLELSPTEAVEKVDQYSYHFDDNVLTFDVPYDPNDRIIVVEELTNRCVMAYAKNSSNSVFVQNVTFVGGGQMIYGYGTAEVMANIVCDDVRALYGTAGCNATYCKVLLHKSRFDQIAGDAISYAHCDYFEFETVGANCTDTTTHTSNGSTAHNGCKGVRAGGNYYNNEGANVADTANCESVCVCCKAAYSCAKDRTADNPGHSIGFIVEDNTKMWLINCEAVYNAKDLSVSGSTSSMYASGCAFNSQAGVSFV